MIKPSEMSEQEIIMKVGGKLIGCSKNGDRPFELSFKESVKLFKATDVCYYTGQPFDDFGDITFERINPFDGYVKGNVVLVKSKVNSFKGFTLDKFIKENSMDNEDAGNLLIRLGKELVKHSKRRKAAKAEAERRQQQRLQSLSEQTKLIIGRKAV